METATFHKLFGKVFIKALLIGLLPASHAFYTSADLRAVPALAGNYGPEGPSDPVVSDAERETMLVTESRIFPQEYKILISNGDGAMEFDSRLFQLAVTSGAPAYFLDLAPKKDPQKHFGSLAKHLTAQIRWRTEGLELSFPPEELVAAAGLEARVSPERKDDCVKDDPTISFSAGDYCSQTLTAPTSALQDLLRANAGKNLFGRTVSLHRIKPAGR